MLTVSMTRAGWTPQAILSGEMHLTERFRRIDFGHIEIEVTIDDPKNYTKPFTVKSNQVLRADTDLLEFVCSENEKDANHYSGH